MGIIFLVGLLFGVVTVLAYELGERKKQDKQLKWGVVIILTVFGMLLGLGISIDFGKNVTKKYLASHAPVTVLENIALLPFSNSNEAYIVTGENQYGRKVAWYLQEELFEEPYDEIINRNMIIFTNATAPTKQLVKVNVGSFWKWFAIIPNTYRFVIPAGGLQEGRIVKNYKFIPKS